MRAVALIMRTALPVSTYKYSIFMNAVEELVHSPLNDIFSLQTA
jgi:hypothetical protein